MTQIIHATFAGGAFQPDEDPCLPANTRVRLTIEQLGGPGDDRAEALRELEELWSTESVLPGPPPMTRDQLHGRN